MVFWCPRVSNLATSGSVNGQLVYLTIDNGGNLQGFHYWDGVQWIRIEDGSVTDNWSLSGNTGTVNGTNFIGTTDAQDLDIRTNNTIRHRFTQQGQLEFLNTGMSVFIGEGAGANDDLSNNRNTFVGRNAGQSSVDII